MWRCNTWTLLRVKLVGSKGGLHCAGTPQILMPSWPPATHAPRLFLGTFHRFSSRTLQVANSFFSWPIDLWVFMRCEYPWELDRLLSSHNTWPRRFLWVLLSSATCSALKTDLPSNRIMWQWEESFFHV